MRLCKILILAFFLGSGCTSLPVSEKTPLKMVYGQKTKKGSFLKLTLINKSMEKIKKPKDLYTKVCEDSQMINLIKFLNDVGFFENAELRSPRRGATGYLCLDSGQKIWTFEKPSVRSQVGIEDFRKKLRIYLKCLGLFKLVYDSVFYMVPLKVKDGRKYFLELKKELEREKRKGLRK